MRVAFILACASALPACASTMTVSSHVDRAANFAQYRTYLWGPADALPTGDPRLDKDPFFKDHFEGAVTKELARKGLSLSESGTADLLIHYHANVTERLNIAGVDRRYGSCLDEDCRAQITEYEAGTLVLDVVDARTNRLIWRGWAQSSVKEMLESRDTMDRQISEAVRRMLARFGKGL